MTPLLILQSHNNPKIGAAETTGFISMKMREWYSNETCGDILGRTRKALTITIASIDNFVPYMDLRVLI